MATPEHRLLEDGSRRLMEADSGSHRILETSTSDTDVAPGQGGMNATTRALLTRRAMRRRGRR